MTVKKTNGIWRVDTRVGGTRIKRSTDATNKKEALAVEASIREQIANGVPPGAILARDQQPGENRPVWTLGDACDRALRYEWSAHRSVDSYHRPRCNALKKILGADHEFASITVDELMEYRDNVAEGEITNATFNRTMQVLNTLIVLCRDEWDKPYPKKLKPLKLWLRESERFRILRNGEEDKLVQAAGQRVGPEYQDFVVASLDIGWRLSEGLRLTTEDVDLESRNVSLWNTKVGSRTMPLTRRATEAIERQINRVSPGDRLWAFPKDRNTVYWRRTREAAGIQDAALTFHCLRHTNATRLLASGRDIHVVGRWLGHKDIRTTQRYAKVLPGMLEDARDGLEEAV